MAFATAFWIRQNPLGKAVLLPDGTRLLVVGVASDLQSLEFDVPDGPRLYVRQDPQAPTGELMVRFDGPAQSLAPLISRTIRDLDSTQLASPLTLQSIRDEEGERTRPLTEIILWMALLTLVLALSGVYGTVAFSMSLRAREFGICIALGATGGRILRSALGSAIRQIAIGLLVGVSLALPTAFAFWHVLRSRSLFDWRTYAVAALVLTITALCAYYIPARRAMNVDPMVALRHE